MKRTRANSGGFTLMEILAAFFILSIGIGSVLGILTSTVSRERTAVMRGRIAEALPFVTEIVQAHVAENSEPGPLARRQVPGFPGLYFQATVTPVEDWFNEYVADIGVTWKQDGSARMEKFVLFLSGEEPFFKRASKRLFNSEIDIFDDRPDTE